MAYYNIATLQRVPEKLNNLILAPTSNLACDLPNNVFYRSHENTRYCDIMGRNDAALLHFKGGKRDCKNI